MHLDLNEFRRSEWGRKISIKLDGDGEGQS